LCQPERSTRSIAFYPGTPQRIARKVDGEVRKTVQTPDMKARLRALEVQEFTVTHEKCTSFSTTEAQLRATRMDTVGVLW
jgi:tripartite-type tricarboxylate transporter receptor subunit TctC